jgi:seryl-tRNA synthetase
MAGQNAFREVISCSNCTDYQARRLAIRYRDKTNEDTRLVHTLNGTLVATERMLVAILEHYQNRAGSVRIPDVLQKYMNDAKEIRLRS